MHWSTLSHTSGHPTCRAEHVSNMWLQSRSEISWDEFLQEDNIIKLEYRKHTCVIKKIFKKSTSSISQSFLIYLSQLRPENGLWVTSSSSLPGQTWFTKSFPFPTKHIKSSLKQAKNAWSDTCIHFYGLWQTFYRFHTPFLIHTFSKEKNTMGTTASFS